MTAAHLLLRQTLGVLDGGNQQAADREVARFVLFVASYVERAGSLAPITIGAATLAAAIA